LANSSQLTPKAFAKFQPSGWSVATTLGNKKPFANAEGVNEARATILPTPSALPSSLISLPRVGATRHPLGWN